MSQGFSKDSREVMEEVVGKSATRIFIWSLWVTGIAGGILAGGALVVQTNRRIVQPYVVALFENLRAPQIDGQVWVSLALTVLLMVIAIAIIMWRFKAWQKVFYEVLDHYVKVKALDRIEHLEQNTCSLTETNEILSSLDKRVAALEWDTRKEKLANELMRRPLPKE